MENAQTAMYRGILYVRRGHSGDDDSTLFTYQFNPLPTNDAPMRHDLSELSISLLEFIWGF